MAVALTLNAGNFPLCESPAAVDLAADLAGEQRVDEPAGAALPCMALM